jgi:hypothetical protein
MRRGVEEYIHVVILCIRDGCCAVWQRCCIEALCLLAGAQRSEELRWDGVQRSINTMKESDGR